MTCHWETEPITGEPVKIDCYDPKCGKSDRNPDR